ncbi:unnamed protein product [Didymodactylos carnosus]|uniref:Amine oxidase n=1 Tax=Didymodactylos carnosus TaxID=1234261 RepID=A0A8S2XS98_9BILA|nr:unnamed protein product [Didymodactylos carnosus]CAF4513931.1 unnamed protein product [Didymodactylos carnosus]
MTYDEQKLAVIEQFSRLFNKSIEFIRSEFIEILHTDWTEEEYERGGYESFCTPGTLILEGDALKKPIDRLLFAGTETAAHYKGYIDGAIEAGYRAADEVASMLCIDRISVQ